MINFLYKFIIFEIGLVALVLLFHLCTKKYVNYYWFAIKIGSKGCGKSTDLSKLAYTYLKKGWTVYADIGNTDVEGVEHIDLKANPIHTIPFKEHSLLLIDEISMLYNDRDFKTFDRATEDWFREQRKHKVRVISYSQDYGIDKKIRNLTDYVIEQKKVLRVISYGVKYRKKLKLQHPDENALCESRWVDDYVRVPFIFGGLSFTYIPRWVRSFDSNRILSRRTP